MLIYVEEIRERLIPRAMTRRYCKLFLIINKRKRRLIVFFKKKRTAVNSDKIY